ncbi:hypothetical protein K040078D81_45510 [Blautia hominis]|uniref:Uncharacterized protein n=1 Tax=Blautia hominis TaxID=2025493 RepID=A0ABQ0BG83_9FIRM
MDNKLHEVWSIMIWMIYVVLIIKTISYSVHGSDHKRDIFVLIVIILLCAFLVFLSVYGAIAF